MASPLLNLPLELLDAIIAHHSNDVEAACKRRTDVAEPDNELFIFRHCAQIRRTRKRFNKAFLSTYLLTRTPIVRIEPWMKWSRPLQGTAAIMNDTVATHPLLRKRIRSLHFELGHAYPVDVEKMIELLALGVRRCRNVRKLELTVFFPLREGMDYGKTYVEKCNAAFELREKALAALEETAKREGRVLEVEVMDVQSPPTSWVGAEHRRLERMRERIVFS